MYMRKLVYFALISSFALSACGGGSDDDGTSAPSTQPVSNGSSNATPVSNSNDENMETGSAAQYIIQGGAGYDFTQKSGTGYDFSQKSFTPNDGKDFTNLIIDGKKIDLINGNSRGFTHLESYSIFGVLHLDDGRNVIFHQGIPTETNDMPQDNNVKYKGGAMASFLNGAREGSSDFVVNFGEKKLTGDIQWHNDIGDKQTHIEATINGNTFSGTSGSVKSMGKFYGPKAANLAGTFYDSSAVEKQPRAGVFGAFRTN